MSTAPVLLEVLEVLKAPGRVVFAVRCLQGEPEVGAVVESKQSGARWRISGIGFASAEAWSDGRRALSLEPLAGDQALPEQGDLLGLAAA